MSEPLSLEISLVLWLLLSISFKHTWYQYVLLWRSSRILVFSSWLKRFWIIWANSDSRQGSSESIWSWLLEDLNESQRRFGMLPTVDWASMYREGVSKCWGIGVGRTSFTTAGAHHRAIASISSSVDRFSLRSHIINQSSIIPPCYEWYVNHLI